jgi:hypothetical protein
MSPFAAFRDLKPSIHRNISTCRPRAVLPGGHFRTPEHSLCYNHKVPTFKPSQSSNLLPKARLCV